jgi:hypothetical protein
MNPTDPRELLKAFSEQRATVEQVMRCLTAHTGWYVPAVFAANKLGSVMSEHSIIFSSEFQSQPAQLVLFTDSVAAHRADGQKLGIYCSGSFSGSRIFAALNGQFEAVSVNPWSPKAECSFFRRDGFSLANLWGQVVELENALATDPESDATFAKLGAHTGYIILVNDQKVPIDVALSNDMGRCAIAFTAPDRYEAFMAERTEAERSRLFQVPVAGSVLFKHLQSFDMPGLLLHKTAFVAKANFSRICALAGV